MINHFKKIAKVSPLKQLIYNIPGRSIVDLSFDSFKELNKVFGKNEPALLYNYKNESTDLEIVSGNPQEVSERIKARLVNSQANHAVIRGINNLWDVSLLKFIFEYTKTSAKSNFQELNSSGMLDVKNGIPIAAR